MSVYLLKLGTPCQKGGSILRMTNIWGPLALDFRPMDPEWSWLGEHRSWKGTFEGTYQLMIAIYKGSSNVRNQTIHLSLTENMFPGRTITIILCLCWTSPSTGKPLGRIYDAWAAQNMSRLHCCCIVLRKLEALGWRREKRKLDGSV